MADEMNDRRLAELEERLRAVEASQDLILRILSTTRPLDRLLEQYGATEVQGLAVHRFLDELSANAKGPEKGRPTFPYFEMQMHEIFPQRRGDREFIALFIDTLKIERLAYRDLHAYMVAKGWPAWRD
jgi:hypothetical protein